MTKLQATLCTLGFWATVVDARAANLLNNPSFEVPFLSNPLLKGGQSFVNPSAIGGWQVGGGPGAVDIFQCPLTNNTLHAFAGSNYCSANDGSQYLSLSTQGSLATVSQSVQTRTNGRYLVQFKVAAATDPTIPSGSGIAPAVLPTVRVEASDDLLAIGNPKKILGHKEVTGIQPRDATGNQVDHSLDWKPAEFYFRATSGSTTITLSDVSYIGKEPAASHHASDASFIDNIILEEAPSPFEINPSKAFGGLVFLVLGFSLWYFIIRRRRNGLRAQG
jgi:Protein of unknown function (DUF642)